MKNYACVRSKIYLLKLSFVAMTMICSSCQKSEEKGNVVVHYQKISEHYILPKGVEVNNLKQGIWIEYDSTIGFIRTSTVYKNGIVEGDFIFYNPIGNGRIIQKGQCHIGKYNGLFECFNDNGTLSLKGHYLNNKRLGKWYEYDKNGKLTKVELWDKGYLVK